MMYHKSMSRVPKHTYAILYTRLFTHCGRVMHIFVSNLTTFSFDDGLLPDECQAIIWTSAEIL